jgi:hypothetical protein
VPSGATTSTVDLAIRTIAGNYPSHLGTQNIKNVYQSFLPKNPSKLYSSTIAWALYLDGYHNIEGKLALAEAGERAPAKPARNIDRLSETRLGSRVLEIKVAAIARLLFSAFLDTTSDVEILKTVVMFCAVGLTVSMMVASYGLDLSLSKPLFLCGVGRGPPDRRGCFRMPASPISGHPQYSSTGLKSVADVMGMIVLDRMHSPHLLSVPATLATSAAAGAAHNEDNLALHRLDHGRAHLIGGLGRIASPVSIANR